LAASAITAALILLLLFVLAFGILQQSLSLWMTLEGDEVGGVLGTPRPQTGMPSDKALDIICDGMILQQS